METITKYMEDDHDRLDQIFKEFKDAKTRDKERARQLFHNFRIGLRRHIAWEEDILFPIFEERTGMRDSGPTAVMRIEHQQIKEFLDKIHASISQGNFQTETFEEGLIEVLSAHNDKEESILYPAIDEAISISNELARVFKRMEAVPESQYHDCCST